MAKKNETKPKEIVMAKSQSKSGTANAVHLMCQAKGGVGKSTCAAFLTQFLQHKGRAVEGLDADPSNHTLAAYKGLPVSAVELMEDGEVNPKRFDAVMQRLLTEDKDFVVDTGASSFISLWNYVVQNDALEMLRTSGRRVYVHVIVAGGGAQLETLYNLKTIAPTVTGKEIIVWVNEHEAKVEKGDKKLPDMAAFKESADKIAGTVLVERRNPQTFGADLRKMITDRLTFGEARNGSGYTIMEKQRLKLVWEGLTAELEALELA